MNGRNENSQHRLFLPVFLISLAVVGWFGFQTTHLVKERSNLATLKENQGPTHDNAVKLRAQLDTIAASTQKLADAGNPNAQAIVNALRQRGITTNPEAGPKPRP